MRSVQNLGKKLGLVNMSLGVFILGTQDSVIGIGVIVNEYIGIQGYKFISWVGLMWVRSSKQS